MINLPGRKYDPERDRAATRIRVAKWRRDNRDRQYAIGTLAYAVHNYDIDRGRYCERCGADKDVCGFAPDISRPLKNVSWRCRRCNNELRREAAATASSDQASPSQP
jgi:hypothetical protein